MFLFEAIIIELIPNSQIILMEKYNSIHRFLLELLLSLHMALIKSYLLVK